MNIYESAENYLEAILSLRERHGMVRSIDIANELGTDLVVLWLAREGSLCAESKSPVWATKMLIEAINKMLAYDPKVRICIEPKPNEPIDRSICGTMGHVMAISAATIDPSRVGGNLESAHAILAGLDPAHEIGFAMAMGKLMTVHLNDQNGIKYDQDKTFELSFGNLKGGGRYRFSLDRNQLALVDGDFSAADTLGDDIAWTLRALTESAQGRVLAPEEEAKGVTLLSRTPTGTPSLPEATDTPEATAGEDAKADTGDGSKSGNDDGGAEPDKADATPAPDTSDKADDRA